MRDLWYVRLLRFGVAFGQRYDRDSGTTVLQHAVGTPLCAWETPSGLHHPSDEAIAREGRVAPSWVAGVIREAWLQGDGVYGVLQCFGEPAWLRPYLATMERRGTLDSPAALGFSLRGAGMRAPEPDGTHTTYLTRLDAVEIVEQPKFDGRFLRSFAPRRPEDRLPVRVRLPAGSLEGRP